MRMEDRLSNAGTVRKQAGFTLIELLVVVAIIALLISILMPSLQNARDQAKAVKCASNLAHVGKAFGAYLGENRSVYPPAYLYASDAAGNYDIDRQTDESRRTFGYLHWSWFLYSQGQVQDDAFSCPQYENGGAPRTNPGPEDRHWESGQVDSNNNRRPGGDTSTRVEDKQAPRMAYGANAAIVPRNKFRNTAVIDDSNCSSLARLNKWVRESELNTSRKIVLATEYFENWRAIGKSLSGNPDGDVVSKSHRSIVPFENIGYDCEYAVPQDQSGFVYGDPDLPYFGLEVRRLLLERDALIEGSVATELNAVGRHHPGGDDFGGSTNFLFIDGSVERKELLETLKRREWGDRFYSMEGKNEIRLNYGDEES